MIWHLFLLKVVPGGEGWTEETTSYWLSGGSFLQFTYDHHRLLAGETNICFATTNKWNNFWWMHSTCEHPCTDYIICFISSQAVVPDIRGVQVLVVFGLISAYELGPGPITWFIGAELFDQPAQPIAMAFTSMLNWGGKFLLALLFPLLLVCLSIIYNLRRPMINCFECK